MADVRGQPFVRLSERSSRGRGQLILVTALSLAILFVALALILNTAIYTENLATRASDIGGGTDAVRYHDASRDGVGGVIDYINAHNNSSHSTLQGELEDGVEAFRNQSARQFAQGDRAVAVTLNTTVNGTRIAQTDGSRNASNASGFADWTVASGVNDARAIEINVTNDATLEAPDSGVAFELVLEDGDGDTWRLNVTSDTSQVVGVKNGSGDHFTCSGSTTPVIDLDAGTVDGAECDGLVFAEGIDTPYTITINHGDNVTATYSLVVDDEALAGSPGPHLETVGSGQPFAAHAVYAATVDVEYRTARLSYEATVRVAPEEPDG